MSHFKAPAGLRIGHVHLHVTELKRSIAFYRDYLGFDTNVEFPDLAFLSAGGYHHHLGLNTWGMRGAVPASVRRPGLYHFALNYPEKSDLVAALRHLINKGHRIDGAADHGTHLAIYISDPDGNGIELAWDRAPSFWHTFMTEKDPEKLRQSTKRLDVQALLTDPDSMD